MEHPRIDALVIGEALIDIVSSDGVSVEYVGGGPANIAMGLTRLGASASLLACIADDARGRRIADALEAEGVSLHPGSFSATQTPTAHATLAADGSATYVFDIEWRVPETTTSDYRLVHAGSIGLFLEPGASVALEILRRASATGIVTLDPNIRPPLMPPHAEALARFEEAAALANLVKLSDEDAAWLYPAITLEEAAERICELGPAFCVLTLGADGVFARTPDGEVRLPAYRVMVADTISAGDTFMASLIAGLLEHGPRPDTHALTAQLDFAARAAALAVSVPGAAPPTRAEVEAMPSALERDAAVETALADPELP